MTPNFLRQMQEDAIRNELYIQATERQIERTKNLNKRLHLSKDFVMALLAISIFVFVVVFGTFFILAHL